MGLELVVGKMAAQLMQVGEQELRRPGLEWLSLFQQFLLVQQAQLDLDCLEFLVGQQALCHLEVLAFLEAQQGRGRQGILEFLAVLGVPDFQLVQRDLGHQDHLEILAHLVCLEVQQVPGRQEILELPDLR